MFFFIFVIKKISQNPGIFGSQIISKYSGIHRGRDYEISNPGIFKNQFRLACLLLTYRALGIRKLSVLGLTEDLHAPNLRTRNLS